MPIPIRHGLLLIKKPVGISSFACIKYLKKIIQTPVKIGHAGTLDPFASGLLIIAIGREATRLMPQLMTLKKTYKATAQLGELTDTLDSTGTITAQCDASSITDEHLHKAIASLGSSYEQIPPLYSALKHNGVALYKLARQQHISVVELQTIAVSKRKTVQLYDVQLMSFQFPYFTVYACVSHGTYIRSLMNDIAIRVHTCATTYALERLAIGPFTADSGVALYDIKSITDINSHVITVHDVDIFNI